MKNTVFKNIRISRALLHLWPAIYRQFTTNNWHEKKYPKQQNSCLLNSWNWTQEANKKARSAPETRIVPLVSPANHKIPCLPCLDGQTPYFVGYLPLEEADTRIRVCFSPSPLGGKYVPKQMIRERSGSVSFCNFGLNCSPVVGAVNAAP
jgi:hypothetical protein